MARLSFNWIPGQLRTSSLYLVIALVVFGAVVSFCSADPACRQALPPALSRRWAQYASVQPAASVANETQPQPGTPAPSQPQPGLHGRRFGDGQPNPAVADILSKAVA
jgi:hypothetical protein